MEKLYDMLFPARKYEEDTVDGEKATEELKKDGSELAHTKIAAKGRGRGRRRAAGRGHTPGGEKEETDEPEKEEVDVAHAKKAAKGRGKGKRKAAGRRHTPGVEEGPEKTQKEKAHCIHWPPIGPLHTWAGAHGSMSPWRPIG